MQRVAAWAGERQIAALTEDALVQRLHASGAFLEAVTRRLLTRPATAACWHGRVLRIADSTSLSGPAAKEPTGGCTGAYGAEPRPSRPSRPSRR